MPDTPVLFKDGKVRVVPEHLLDLASKDGGVKVVKMFHGGDQRWVPEPQVNEAVQSGATFSPVNEQAMKNPIASEGSGSANPGFFGRFAEGAGIPTSFAQVGEMAHTILNPVYAAKMYGRNVAEEWAKLKNELSSARQNIREGQSVGANVGKDASAIVEFLLRGIASPLGGGTLQTMGEDIHAGNYGAAAGDAAGFLTQALIAKYGTKKAANKVLRGVSIPGEGIAAQAARNALRKAISLTEEVPNRRMVEKLSYASNIGGNAVSAIPRVADDLRETAEHIGKPKNVDEYANLIEQTNQRFLSEQASAMMNVASQAVTATGIRDKIMALIPEEMRRNPAKYRKEIAYIENRAKEWDRPTTVRDLDFERKQAGERLSDRGYYDKAKRPSIDQKIDRIIQQEASDIVTSWLDKAAGKPEGYFREQRSKQADLIKLRDQVREEAQELKAKKLKTAGAPLSQKVNISTYGTTSGRPGVALHRLTALFHTPDPYKRAGKAVRQGFGKKDPMSFSRRAYLATAPQRNVVSEKAQEETEEDAEQ